MIVDNLPTAVELATEWTALKKKLNTLEKTSDIQELKTIVIEKLFGSDYDRIKELEAKMAAIDVYPVEPVEEPAPDPVVVE